MCLAEHEGDIAMEHVNKVQMHRLWFGKSLIKPVVPVKDPGVPAAPGGIRAAPGTATDDATIHNLMKS
jgi:hypothetical protein